ncbi:MAG: Hsp20/alpha crystallin family protein [Planctomycetaceae bacterium]
MSSDFTHFIQTLLSPSSEGLRRAAWSPSVDVYRMRDGWLLKFDLAGVRPQDIECSLHGRRLVVRGRRRDWVVEESGSCSAYSMEISYSHFERSVELPCDIEPLHIATEYRDGMLLVRLRAEGTAA